MLMEPSPNRSAERPLLAWHPASISAAIGAIIFLVGIFLPWVSYPAGVADVYGCSGIGVFFFMPLLTIILPTAATVLCLTGTRSWFLASTVAISGGVVLLVVAVTAISNEETWTPCGLMADHETNLSPEIGLWVSAAGAAVCVISGLAVMAMLVATRRAHRAPQVG